MADYGSILTPLLGWWTEHPSIPAVLMLQGYKVTWPIHCVDGSNLAKGWLKLVESLSKKPEKTPESTGEFLPPSHQKDGWNPLNNRINYGFPLFFPWFSLVFPGFPWFFPWFFPWIFPTVAPEDHGCHGCHGHDASPQIVIVPAGSATEAVRRRRGQLGAAKWGFGFVWK